MRGTPPLVVDIEMTDSHGAVAVAGNVPKERRAKRIKTFSGCQTCRSRHLKCDETLPTCLRCSKSGIQCSGYPGYRASLRWTAVQGISDHGANPTKAKVRDTTSHQSSDAQRTPRTDRSTPSSPTAQTDSFLLSQPFTLARSRRGIFSARPVSEEASGSGLLRRNELLQEPDIVVGDGCLHVPQSSLDVDSRRGIGESRVVHGSDGHDYEHTAVLETVTAANPLYTPESPSIITLASTCRDGTSGDVHRHIDQLPMMHLQRRLLEFWVNHLGDAFAPIPGARNPWKTMFVPIALEGALASIDESNGSVALFHLICAAAAEHLSKFTTEPTNNVHLDYRNMSLDHYSKGIWHLHRSLSAERPRSLDPMLACLLICIIYEPAIAENGSWRLHFQGAIDWLRVTDISQILSSKSTVILYQMLTSTIVMLRSQLLCPELLSVRNQAFLDQDILATLEPYHLESIVGVAQKTLSAIIKTIALVAEEHRKSHCVIGRSSAYQAGGSRDLDQMELELFLSMPKQPDDTGQPTNAETSLIYHYSCIFYFASLIYFKRSLREAPLEDVQDLVEQSLGHIEALQKAITRPFAPMMWPVAITIFEIKGPILQKRALDCLDWHITRSPLSVWERCKSVVTRLWAERSENDAFDLQWDHFVANDSTNGAIMMV